MLNMGLEALLKATKTIGLYISKAKNIIAMSEMLIQKFDGKVPDNRTDLLALPGVGRKTADVVLNVIYKIPVVPVDTHVMQFVKILGWSTAKSANKMAKDLEELLPKHLDLETLSIAYHLMVLYNRNICRGEKQHEFPIPNYCIIKKAVRSQIPYKCL